MDEVEAEVVSEVDLIMMIRLKTVEASVADSVEDSVVDLVEPKVMMEIDQQAEVVVVEDVAEDVVDEEDHVNLTDEVEMTRGT